VAQFVGWVTTSTSGSRPKPSWSRILDPASPVHAVVAEREGGDVVGNANYVVHENTSALTPACYLQDLFVQPHQRAAGVGKLLIDWLVEEMKVEGWSRLYWNTKEKQPPRSRPL